jgi:amidase
LVGLKPSRGRHIVSELVRALPVAVVSDGVLTRSVRDTAVFHAEMEKVYKNPKLPEIGLVNSPTKSRLKIGLQLDSINNFQSHTEVKEVINKTAADLESAGHEIVEVAIPVDEQFTEDFILYWSFLAFSIPTIGKKKVGNAVDVEKLEPFTKKLDENFRKQFLKFPGSLWRLRRIHHRYNKIFSHCDVLLTPVLAQPPAPLGYISPDVPFDNLIERLKSYACFTPLANVSGAPAISIPAGLTENGLPVGAHLFGQIGDERTLLELAFQLEEIQAFPKIYDTDVNDGTSAGILEEKEPFPILEG